MGKFIPMLDILSQSHILNKTIQGGTIIMRKTYWFAVVIGFSVLSILSINGCWYTDPPENTGNSKLTYGEAKRQITKGETKQSDILEVFGSPNLVSKNKNDEEVWAYNRMSYDTMAGNEGASLIFIGGSKTVSSSTTKSFDLIITFDSNEVVKDYKVISASY